MNHQSRRTTEQEREFNVRNGLRPRALILAIALALLIACLLGVYFGFFAGRILMGA